MEAPAQLADALEALETLLREKEEAFGQQEFALLGDRYQVQGLRGKTEYSRRVMAWIHR